MRIAVNCRSILLSQRTGIGRYTYHLLDSLGKVDVKNDYILYAPKRPFDFKRRLPVFPYKNFKPRVDCFGRGPGRADIYHLPCPDHIGRFPGKVVVTIHDLIHRAYPQGHTPSTIAMTEAHMRDITARADKIICTSESTREDLHRFYTVPAQCTCTVLNGVDHNVFHPLADKKDEGFILCVGTIEPRKNLQGLLQAMAQIKTAAKLVVVGMKGWMTEEIMPRIAALGLTDRVVFTGFISDAELNVLYNTCRVFVFPSFYEGFGFPIVEAFCAGAVVVASKTSSCCEIAGDAALLIDPADPAQIAVALRRALEDEGLRAQLKKKALARATQFSFERTARETLEVYRNVCSA